MPTAAADYLREVSSSMNGRYVADCVTHACRLAELLLAEGHAPWIGRLRQTIVTGDRVFHGPLTPKRIPAVTWTTHYVACSGREVYDPLAERPVDVDEYAAVVFGVPLPIETHLDAPETARLLASGEIRQTFRPARAAGPSAPADS